MTPEFGLTQYRLGAVVLILKQTLRSDGLVSRIEDETWLVNGPERGFEKPKIIARFSTTCDKRVKLLVSCQHNFLISSISNFFLQL